jgi:hypothetical protein
MSTGLYEPLQNSLLPTGSIDAVMEELVALEKSVASQFNDLRVYKWQPNTAQLPALWNWIAPSPFQMMDLSRGRDSLALVASVGIAHTDNEVEMDRLCHYADAFRNVVDQAFWQGRGIPGSNGPLNGTATKAIRQNMVGPVPVDMNGIPVLTFQFGLLLDLDRSISPTGR